MTSTILPALALSLFGCDDGKKQKHNPAPAKQAQAKVKAAQVPAPAKPMVVSSLIDETPTPTQVLSPIAPPEPEEEMVPSRYRDLVKQGKELRGDGDFGKALSYFETAAEKKPHYLTPQIELARTHLAKGDGDAAKPFAERAIEIDPNSSKAWNTLGRVELARGAKEEAISAFQAAVDANPDNSFAWNNLGYAFLREKKFEDAKVALEAATTGSNVTGYMWNNLGMAYEHAGDSELALAAYRRGAEAGSSKAGASLERLAETAARLPEAGTVPEQAPVEPIE